MLNLPGSSFRLVSGMWKQKVFESRYEAERWGKEVLDKYQPEKLEDVPITERWGCMARWHPYFGYLYAVEVMGGKVIWQTCVSGIGKDLIWSGPEPHDWENTKDCS